MAKAIDTNIVVRVITRDHAAQTETALRIVSADVFVPITVVLETGWVLAGFYKQDRATIADALTGFLDLPTVHVADEPGLRRAIELFRNGADLADAIHLVAAGNSEPLVTFDRKLAKLKNAPVRIELAA